MLTRFGGVAGDVLNGAQPHVRAKNAWRRGFLAVAACSAAMLAKGAAMLALAELLYWDAALVIGTLGKVGRVACMGFPPVVAKKARSMAGLGYVVKRLATASQFGKAASSCRGWCVTNLLWLQLLSPRKACRKWLQ